MSPAPDEQGFVGEVIFRDAFGNLITNINADHLIFTGSIKLEIADERIEGELFAPMATGPPAP